MNKSDKDFVWVVMFWTPRGEDTFTRYGGVVWERVDFPHHTSLVKVTSEDSKRYIGITLENTPSRVSRTRHGAVELAIGNITKAIFSNGYYRGKSTEQLLDILTELNSELANVQDV